MRVSTKRMTDTNVWCIEEYPAAAEYSGKFEVQRIECVRKWGIWYCQVCSPASKTVCPHLDSWANKRWEYDEQKLRKHQVMCRICVKCICKPWQIENKYEHIWMANGQQSYCRNEMVVTVQCNCYWWFNASGSKNGAKTYNKPRIWRRLEPSFFRNHDFPAHTWRMPLHARFSFRRVWPLPGSEESGDQPAGFEARSARSQEPHQNKRVSSWNMATWRAAWEIPEL